MPRFPVIIGATGASNTRAVRGVLERRGFYMGMAINETADALDVIPFFERHVVATLSHTRRVDYSLADLPESLRDGALADLEGAMAAYLGSQPSSGSPWGLKAPRAIYMLPFFRELFPDMLFVQMIRDGRDIAEWRNQLQVHRHYEPLFGEPVGEHPEVAAVRLWAKVNVEAADWCAQHLPKRHLVLKCEDLAERPAAAIGRLLEFLDSPCPAGELATLAARIKPSRATGSRRPAEAAAAAKGLARFGYA